MSAVERRVVASSRADSTMYREKEQAHSQRAGQ